MIWVGFSDRSGWFVWFQVRYQSRKRLAEQRPRVRGQFVRQAVYDPSAGDAE